VTYLLDTNTCIGWLRQNQPQIVARIQAQAQADIVLCSVVVGELLFGVERSDPVHRGEVVSFGQIQAAFSSVEDVMASKVVCATSRR
jgi:predicted nucleic acid-binding protein